MNSRRIFINKWYLILPIGSILFFAIMTLFFNFPKPLGLDFNAFYYAGKYIFLKPALVYSNKIIPGYVYLPGFATIFSVVSLFPYNQALIIYFIILLLFAELSIIYLDRILTARNVKLKIKILILLAVGGGHVVTLIFEMVQSKFIITFLLLFFIKRELNRENESFNMKFYAGQAFILALILLGLPYLAFPALIYLFYKSDGKFTTLLLKKIFILIGACILLNFIVLIYPFLIFDFINKIFNQFILGGSILFRRSLPIMILYYINQFLFSFNWMIISGIIIILFIIINTIYLIKINKPLEIKFGLFALLFLLFSNPFYPNTHYAVLLPLIVLLFRKKNVEDLIAVFLIFLLFYINPFLLFDLGVMRFVLPFLFLLSYPNLIYIILLILYYIQNIDVKLKKIL